MITRDMVTSFILSVNKFMTKRGSDMTSRRELVDAINMMTGENSCEAVYVNNIDNYNIPDVAVIHLYNSEFSTYVMDPDSPDTCPFGYTVEIHERCFTKYTEEEVSALILHDILQNVQSDTAKIRFIKAYTAVTSKHDVSKMLAMFDEINLSEVTFIAFTEICMRPFRVPVMAADYNSTDEVLKAIGLGDAYDSYLEKALQMSNMTPEEAMERELQNDYRDVNTIIAACLDHDIRHYYSMIRESIPIVTLQNILGSRQAVASIGFVSRKREFKRKDTPEEKTVMMESYNDPKTELDIRFQMDKIIASMRYAESEAEREVVLFKIKNLSMQLYNKIHVLEKKADRRNNDPKVLARINYLKECLDELEALRDKTVKMEIKTKRWSVYVKDAMPEGYDF